MRDRKMGSLYVFYFVYFVTMGLTTYLSKYYGDIGLTDGQIGVITAVPAFAGIFLQPIWGMLTDSAKYKKNVLFGALMVAGVLAIVANNITAYVPLLILMTVFSLFTLPITPISSAISLEYTASVGKSFGPIRMMGTIGFQAGLFAVSMFFASSLNNLYLTYGCVLLVTALLSLTLPPVEGHQHKREKVYMTELFKDKNIVLLFLVVFIACITSMFYNSFFAKHLGDIGVSNYWSSNIILFSVFFEIPFLFFGDKLMKLFSVWKWLMIGLVLNGIRWLLIAYVRNVPLLFLIQLPTVTVMACFEFFPSLYINSRVPDTLKGTAQTTLNLVTFGLSKIIGSLAGGFIAERFSLSTVFLFNGILLLAAAAIFAVPLYRMNKKENEGNEGNGRNESPRFS